MLVWTLRIAEPLDVEHKITEENIFQHFINLHNLSSGRLDFYSIRNRILSEIVSNEIVAGFVYNLSKCMEQLERTLYELDMCQNVRLQKITMELGQFKEVVTFYFLEITSLFLQYACVQKKYHVVTKMSTCAYQKVLEICEQFIDSESSLANKIKLLKIKRASLNIYTIYTCMFLHMHLKTFRIII